MSKSIELTGGSLKGIIGKSPFLNSRNNAQSKLLSQSRMNLMMNDFVKGGRSVMNTFQLSLDQNGKKFIKLPNSGGTFEDVPLDVVEQSFRASTIKRIK